MIAVWGYGSIGRRHLENLLSLGVGDIALITRTPSKINKTVSKSIEIITHPDNLSWDGINSLIIATPTALHTAHLKVALERGAKKIYVEKPISHDHSNIDELTALINTIGAQVYVGYDLRYDPGINKARDIIKTNTLGDVCSCHAHAGHYLPDWRKDQDYRNSMSAFTSLGGGVMLDLSHEIDYLHYLFGDITWVANANGKRSNLLIETEDTSDSLVSFKKGFSGTIHLDYLQKLPTRFFHVIASQGTLHLDFLEKLITWNTIDSDLPQCMDYSYHERNDRFLEIIDDFISPKPSAKLCTWAEGIKSLKVIIESKTSNRIGEIRSVR